MYSQNIKNWYDYRELFAKQAKTVFLLFVKKLLVILIVWAKKAVLGDTLQMDNIRWYACFAAML